jgi:hypothetical protein
MKTLLTPQKIGMVMADISLSLAAVSRLSILLQDDGEIGLQDKDAIHTVIQSTLQRAGLLAEMVTIQTGGEPLDALNGGCPWHCFMPPAFFDAAAVTRSAAASERGAA